MGFLRLAGADPRAIWKRLGRRGRIATVGLVLALGIGAAFAYRWWTAWPPFATIRGTGDLVPTAFSPDGRWLVAVDAREIVLFDREGRRDRSWRHDPSHRVHGGRFSPDGRTFVAGWSAGEKGWEHGYDLIDVASGRRRAIARIPNYGYYGLAFPASDMARVLLMDSQMIFVDFDLTSGEILATTGLGMPFNFIAVALSPDGRTAAVGEVQDPTSAGPAEIRVILWDIEADREIARLGDGPAPCIEMEATFSPDGRSLAVGRDDGSVELWDVATRKLIRTLREQTDAYRVDYLAFSADGSTLVSGGGFTGRGISLNRARLELVKRWSTLDYTRRTEAMVVYDARTGRLRAQLNSYESQPSLSPDGRILATFDLDGSTKLRRVPSR